MDKQKREFEIASLQFNGKSSTAVARRRKYDLASLTISTF
jgi:hypothetical protein